MIARSAMREEEEGPDHARNQVQSQQTRDRNLGSRQLTITVDQPCLKIITRGSLYWKQRVAEEDLDLIANTAGNAYSLWHYGPWICALYATCGRSCELGENSAEPSEASLGSPLVVPVASSDPSSDSE